jgi:hypothetical protein
MLTFYQPYTGGSWLACPVLEIPTSLATLTFKHYYNDYGPGVTMNVRYSNNGGSTWIDGWSLASGSGNAGPAIVTVPINLSGDVIIQWYIYGNHYQYNYWVIDDVCILPNCDLASTWTGAIDDSWTNAGNWSCGVVPGATTRVIIPPHPASGRNPFIAAPLEVEVLSLELMGEAVVTVQTGAKLTVLQP